MPKLSGYNSFRVSDQIGVACDFVTLTAGGTFGPWPRATNSNRTMKIPTSPPVPPYVFITSKGDFLTYTGDTSPALLFTPASCGVSGVAISNPVALTVIETLAAASCLLESVDKIDASTWQLSFRVKQGLKLALILANTQAETHTQAALNSGHQIAVVTPAA